MLLSTFSAKQRTFFFIILRTKLILHRIRANDHLNTHFSLTREHQEWARGKALGKFHCFSRIVVSVYSVDMTTALNLIIFPIESNYIHYLPIFWYVEISLSHPQLGKNWLVNTFNVKQLKIETWGRRGIPPIKINNRYSFCRLNSVEIAVLKTLMTLSYFFYNFSKVKH